MGPWNGLKHSSQNQNQKWTRFIATFRVLERLCKVISMSVLYQFLPEPCPHFCTDTCVLFCMYYLCMRPGSLVRESKLYWKPSSWYVWGYNGDIGQGQFLFCGVGQRKLAEITIMTNRCRFCMGWSPSKDKQGRNEEQFSAVCFTRYPEPGQH